MQQISLVATDLDGTLFYDREHISAPDRAMLARLADAGIVVVLATGREMRLVAPALDRLGLWDAARYVIHSGGSGLFDVASRRDRCLAEMDPQTLRDIYARHHNLPVSFLLMQDEVMHTNRLTKILRHESEILACPVVEEPDFPAVLTRPNSKFVVCGATEELEAALPVLTGDADPRYEFHRSHDNYIDCYARGVGKGTALRTLCAELGIPIEATLAVGDNLNDLQLLETAGRSACPGDGHPDVQPLVDYVACPAQEGAFAEACAHFVFGE